MRSVLSLGLLALLPCLCVAQTAGTTAPLIYTRDPAQSANPSLLSAISTAGLPAAAVGTAAPSPATNLIPAMPTTGTVGPVTIPQLTMSARFSSAVSGEILSTATRAPFLTTGTVDVSLRSTAAAATSARSGAQSTIVVGNYVWVAGTAVFGLAVGAMVL